jgi:alkylation response protein AidB-like acyl-CoA dehydrogenase
MSSAEEYLYDLHETQFVLFEHLRVQRLFEFPAYSSFEIGDVEMLLNEGLRFCQKVLSAVNSEGDREGCRWEDGRVFMPKAFHSAYKQQCAAGWMAISTEVEHGGQGMPFAIGAALGEMFVGANCSLSMVAGLTRAAADLVISHGSAEMKRRYVKPMVEGRWGGTMCLTEAQCGTALGEIKTTATKRDGKYFLKGQKIFISGGEHDLVDNIVHLVLARVEGAPAGTKGLSLFVVPKHRVDDAGRMGEFNDVVCSGIEKKLGIHASPTCQLVFGDADQCEGELIGAEEEGIKIMFDMMNGARIGVGLQGVALGGWAYQSALGYARERKQGPDMKNFRDPTAPSVPIAQHPDVRRMLATMKAYVEGGRALLLHAAMCLDIATHGADAAERDHMNGRIELLTPICKAWCSDTGFEVATLALQTYGGHGYLKDYPVEQLLRDAKIASIYEGTNGVQAMDLLGRKVGRQGGALFMQLVADINQFVAANKDNATLGPALTALERHTQKLQEITMNFAVQQMSGDMEYPLLSATPYLRLMGNIAVGWLLLEQAVVADRALAKLYAETGAGDDAARAKLCDEQPDAQFYDNKVKTAQFFASNLLSQNDHLATAIQSTDRSPLDMHF